MAPSCGVSIQLPGAVGAPSRKRSSASMSSPVLCPQLHRSCDSPVRRGRFDTAHGVPGRSARGAGSRSVGDRSEAVALPPVLGVSIERPALKRGTRSWLRRPPGVGGAERVGDDGRLLGRECGALRVGDGSRLAAREDGPRSAWSALVSELTMRWCSASVTGDAPPDGVRGRDALSDGARVSVVKVGVVPPPAGVAVYTSPAMLPRRETIGDDGREGVAEHGGVSREYGGRWIESYVQAQVGSTTFFFMEKTWILGC